MIAKPTQKQCLERQDKHGCPSDRSNADDPFSIGLKVLIPNVPARVEERHL
jgi:hypothetical protein